MNITNEHGKALKDAYGDVLSGLGQYLFLYFIIFSHLLLSVNNLFSNGLLYKVSHFHS